MIGDTIEISDNARNIARTATYNSFKAKVLHDNSLPDDIVEDRIKLMGLQDFVADIIECSAADFEYTTLFQRILNDDTANGRFKDKGKIS